MNRNFIHPETIYNVSQLNEELKKGGGRTATKSSYGPKSQSLLQTFQSTGWKQSTLQKRFKNLTDELENK